MGGTEPVVIAGAGIGGLALGAALARAGVPFEIFERAEELREVGAGLAVQTGPMLALRRLGLDVEVASVGHEIRTAVMRTAGGTVLGRTSLEGLAAPMVALHRARLQGVLRAHVPDARVHTGRAVAGCEQDDRGVRVTLADGSSVTGALLVGADGLRSVVRVAVAGETPLRYAGYTSWRGVATRDDLGPLHEACEILGRGLRFGVVPIGEGQTYWFAVANSPEGGRDEGDVRAALLDRFSPMGEPAASLIAATPPERILRTEIHDRAPVASWSRGRFVLLGDAAHPTTPNLGQGGGMAIEDAVVLAHHLARAPYADAIATYERLRVRPTARVVLASRRLGRIVQAEGAFAAWARNASMRATPPALIRRQLRAAARFAVE
ncbi:MAG TPA: FAD-dependent monooxygenase [Polyangia bacterium]|jgi:2-polyprenyl-6-methoxyphenol hydroxylase-like FAD-dependent oxidoreductase|nr:FAD-dependent monooxygenase [Polyangia bacterium]